MKRLVLAAVLLIAAVLVAIHPSQAWKPLVSAGGGVFEGSFERGDDLERAVSGEPARKRATFGTLPGDTGLGSFRSEPFRLPETFRCFVTGFPRAAGQHMFLKEVAGGGELALGNTLDPSYGWEERVWDVPPAWQGRTVRLVLTDQSTDPLDSWVAFTLPEAGAHSGLLPFGRAVYRSALLIVEFAWFLLPGFAVAICILPRNESAPRYAATVLIGSGCIAYALFWVYLAGSRAGVLASGVILAASGGIIWAFRRQRPGPPREVLLLFSVVAIVAVFYNAIGLLYYTEDDPGTLAQHRFNSGRLPPDNMLPYLFSWALYNGHTVKPYLLAEARSSDRPPLATGIALEQYPFWRLLSVPASYQLLGIATQCLWVAGIWILLRASGVPPPALVIVLAVTLFTGFAWLHSYFVWPKLLAAAFWLIGMAFIPVIRGTRELWTTRQAIYASAAFSLSLLSHTGSGFTLPAVFLLLIACRQLPTWRIIWPAALVALLLFLPWRAYQIWVDPPGDALLKLHLAGVRDDQAGVVESLVRGYGQLTTAQLVHNKAANFRALFIPPHWWPGTASVVRNLVDTSFFAFFPCAGMLNLGWLARLRLTRRLPEVRFADRMLLLVLVTLVCWCLLMFEPGTAVVHQGSFAAVLLYFTAMILYLTAWSRTVALTVLALQALFVFPVFVLMTPLLQRTQPVLWNGGVDPGMVVAALASLASLAWLYRNQLQK